MTEKIRSSALLFLGGELFFYFVTLIIALTFVWLIPRMMPGDPIKQLVVDYYSAPHVLRQSLHQR